MPFLKKGAIVTIHSSQGYICVEEGEKRPSKGTIYGFTIE